MYYSYSDGFVLDKPKGYEGYITQKPMDHSDGVKVSNSYVFYPTERFDNKQLSALRNYLEILFLPFDKSSHTSIISHVAQSLDGKIATKDGHSQWIGNDMNLIHAHRIRALVDGVMVGSGTLLCDTPRLTVRHVEGDNPHRFFWSNSISDFTPYEVSNIKTTLIRKHNTSVPKGVSDVICYGDQPDSEIGILTTLKSRGIHTMLLEGGAWTINRFIQLKCVDIMQIHVAPIVLGSGKSPFKFSGTTRIDQALALDGYFMHVGDHMMFTGRPSQE